MVSALRLLGAAHFLGYSKLLSLASPNDAALGQFITFITGDHDRIQEACTNGVLVVATPISLILSIAYAIYIIGPSALVGFLIIVLFYPLMVI